MADEQHRYKHDRVTQHASICNDKSKMLPVIGESSRAVEASSSRGHISPSHDEASATPIHTDVHAHDPHPTTRHDVAAHNSFLGGPKDTYYLLYMHTMLQLTYGKKR